MSSISIDIEVLKRIMREDLADAGIEPDVYLDQESKEEKIFCVHCGTLIPDIVNNQGYTPESRLVRCSLCGACMHASCAAWKSNAVGKRFCMDCVRDSMGAYPVGGSTFKRPNLVFTISGSTSQSPSF